MSGIPFSKLKRSHYRIDVVPPNEFVVGETYYYDPLRGHDCFSITVLSHDPKTCTTTYQYGSTNTGKAVFGKKYPQLTRSGFIGKANLTKYHLGRWVWLAKNSTHPATNIFENVGSKDGS